MIEKKNIIYLTIDLNEIRCTWTDISCFEGYLMQKNTHLEKKCHSPVISGNFNMKIQDYIIMVIFSYKKFDYVQSSMSHC
jgi:hypothetical protein